MADPHHELGDFLRRARAASDPRHAALPADGRVRRVPGLRREEVALLAGVSTDYYTRLEQGRRIVPSTQVLEALGRALDLDHAGRTHLRDLVRAAGSPPPRARTAAQRVRPGLHQLLDALTDQPAMILGHRTDVLATNPLARALFADFDRMPPRERNYARWMLLSEDARSLFIDWETQARNAVEALRLDAGRTPGDPDTQQLVGELSLASDQFRRWWSEHQVHQRGYGAKRLRHPLVGDLTVDFETLSLPADGEQTLYVYTTAPHSPSREALALLSSWTLPGAPAQGASAAVPEHREEMRRSDS
jgi:transcriptional regulator with XRE-family HTH domain